MQCVHELLAHAACRARDDILESIAELQFYRAQLFR